MKPTFPTALRMFPIEENESRITHAGFVFVLFGYLAVLTRRAGVCIIKKLPSEAASIFQNPGKSSEKGNVCRTDRRQLRFPDRSLKLSQDAEDALAERLGKAAECTGLWNERTYGSKGERYEQHQHSKKLSRCGQLRRRLL